MATQPTLDPEPNLNIRIQMDSNHFWYLPHLSRYQDNLRCSILENDTIKKSHMLRNMFLLLGLGSYILGCSLCLA